MVQPLWQLVLFTFVFSAVLKFRLPEGEPIASFPVFLFAALIPWSAFNEGVSRSTTAITDNASLVKKLSFPPELLISSAIAGGLVQSALSAGIFIVYLAIVGDLSLVTLPWLLLALPLQVALTLGIGLLLAALQVYLRDVVQVVGVGLTTWFYLTPIVYPFSMVPEWLQVWISLNPLTGLVGLYRLAFVGGSSTAGLRSGCWRCWPVWRWFSGIWCFRACGQGLRMKSEPGAQPRIEARGLGKTYRLYPTPWHRLLERLGGAARHREHVALEPLDLSLRAGEGLGIVGPNGAGKSTLLSLLAGVLEPSRGEVTVRGTVSSILELGAGFHPEFTGAQNIRINAAMLGLSESAVEERTPAIVEFCELGSFIDEPVKFYSSGMSMRLAFAIATQVEPEVLIIDEALSVGDGYFQKKCTDRILELMAGGTCLLFCSHAMYFVERFCGRALWLEHGRVAAEGEVHEVIDAYERELDRRRGQAKKSEAMEAKVNPASADADSAAGPARIREVRMLHAHPEPQISDAAGRLEGCVAYPPGGRWAVEIVWTTSDSNLRFHIGLGVDRSDGVQALSFSTHRHGLDPLSGASRYRCTIGLASLPINLGHFDVFVYLLDEEGVHVYDHRIVENAFEVSSGEYRIGLISVRPDISWGAEESDGSRSAPNQVDSTRSSTSLLTPEPSDL